MRKTTVAEMMVSDVVAVAVDTPWRAVLATLRRRGVSGAPVLDDAGRVVGVVAEADLLAVVAPPAAGRRPLARSRRRPAAGEGMPTAGTLMSAPAVTVGPHDSLAAAAAVMRRQAVGRLPVVDAAGRLRGVLGRRDVLGLALRSDEEVAREITDDVLVRTLGLPPGTVRATVADGTVTIDGEVDRRTTAQILHRLVETTPGVVAVVGTVGWRRDDSREVTSGFFRSHPFSSTEAQPQ